MRLFVPAALIAYSSFLFADFTPQWNQPIAPYRVISNIYYVGSNYLASFLIVTPQGDLLINPDYEQSVPLIRASVEKLGFKFSDIKVILISHAHDDHAAGCALAKKLTKAKLMVMQPDVTVVEGGGAGDFQYKSHWPPAKVDRVLHDGDAVTLGGTTLIAHLTPGHTRGCTTWTMEVNDGGRTLHVVIVGSPNVNPGYQLVGNQNYPQIAQDYERMWRVLKSLPCDIFLGAHGGYFGLEEKYALWKSGRENPFLDPDGYKKFVAQKEQDFRAELAEQQGTPPAALNF